MLPEGASPEADLPGKIRGLKEAPPSVGEWRMSAASRGIPIEDPQAALQFCRSLASLVASSNGHTGREEDFAFSRKWPCT